MQPKKLSKEEIFELTSQIRRSFASIGYNISEGSGRNSDKEFANFINIALGSSNKAENQLILAKIWITLRKMIIKIFYPD
ncbi:four helix bundle protein [Chryseobacterium sp.]|uniref:four helix bundle protein n=1 Tax=Chryseobacterium sp. TaxID=1871047 RepID=UPI00289AF1E1|nr:four helix bundle protein [Chryseobacterium sp.]